MSEIRVNTIDTKDNTSLSIQQNNTTALTIDTSQNVGIGTTSPSVTFDAEADGATIAHFNRTTSDGDIVELQKDGTSVGSIGSREGRMYLHSPSPTGSGLRMGDAFVQPCDSDGSDSDNDTALGQANSRFTDLYLSGNIYLGGTTSANALDDYETGTWTPVYSTQVSSFTSATYASASYGAYTKIGDLVIARCFFEIDALTKGGASGDVYIDGLPFTIDAETTASVGGGALANASSFGGDTPSTFIPIRNDTKVLLKYRTSANGPDNNNLNVTDLGTSDGDNSIAATIIYKAT